jgi:hypothetical protein
VREDIVLEQIFEAVYMLSRKRAREACDSPSYTERESDVEVRRSFNWQVK